MNNPALPLLLALAATALVSCTGSDDTPSAEELRQDIAEDLAADPDAVVIVGDDVDGGDYLDDARDPEGNRFQDDATDATLSTNEEPGFAEPEDAVDEDATDEDPDTADPTPN